MKTNKTKIGSKLLVVIFASALVHSVYSDGYRNPPPTAEGIGKSGANSVFVDDASAISYNPANLSLQTDASFVASFTMARTENTYNPPIPVGPYESSGDWNVLPNLYYARPVGDNGLSFGLGITTPYGQGLAWEATDFVNLVPPSSNDTVPYEASVMMIDINPTVAFKITESIRMGVGLDIYYSMLELKALQGFGAPPPAEVEGEGTGYGLGANAGLTWNTTENQRLALTFRSGFEVEYSGDFKISGANAGDFETTLKYPNTVGIGYGIQLNEKIQIETLIEWLQWSVNDTQSLTAGPLGTLTIQNDWDDTFTVGFGGSWLATDSLVVRAGYAYLPSPIPDATLSPLLPDADRHALSAGLGYMLGNHLFDIAYTYSIYDDRSSPSGTYEIDSNLIGLTYSYSY